MNLIDRICKSYKFSVDQEDDTNNPKDSMWTHWIKPKLTDVLLECYNNNIEKTSYHLNNPDKNSITFGFDNNFFFQNFESLQEHNKDIKLCLFNLCKSLGLFRVFNPEGGERPDLYIVDVDVEDMLSKLDDYFGFKIDFPDIFENNVAPPMATI
jgi:hypothetical protein